MHEQQTTFNGSGDNGNVFTLTNIYTFGINGNSQETSRKIFDEEHFSERYYHEKSSTGCRIVVFRLSSLLNLACICFLSSF